MWLNKSIKFSADELECEENTSGTVNHVFLWASDETSKVHVIKINYLTCGWALIGLYLTSSSGSRPSNCDRKPESRDQNSLQAHHGQGPTFPSCTRGKNCVACTFLVNVAHSPNVRHAVQHHRDALQPDAKRPADLVGHCKSRICFEFFNPIILDNLEQVNLWNRVETQGIHEII